jgi:hypothetical protein
MRTIYPKGYTDPSHYIMWGYSSDMALDTSSGGTPVADQSSIRTRSLAGFPELFPLA